MGGVIFGINSLYPILYKEGPFPTFSSAIAITTIATEHTCSSLGLFLSYCTEEEQANWKVNEGCPDGPLGVDGVCCKQQQQWTGWLGWAGMVAADGSMIMYGEMMDALGCVTFVVCLLLLVSLALKKLRLV
jgi:hypothetical protein